MNMHEPARLQIPQRRMLVVNDDRFALAPITKGDLARHGNHAPDIARAILKLRANLWQDEPWAVKATPDLEERRRLIAKEADDENPAHYEATAYRIAQVGKYSLFIGAYDMANPSLGMPESLVGFVEVSYVVSGPTLLHCYLKRVHRPHSVYPGLNGGPEVAATVKNPEYRRSLYTALFTTALEAFEPSDINSKCRNTLDVYTTETDFSNNAWLTLQGAEQITGTDTGKTYVGATLVRMQFPDLSALIDRRYDISPAMRLET